MNESYHWNWQNQGHQASTQNRQMTLIGDSVVLVEPNWARIRLGVVTADLSLKVSQQTNANTMNDVIETILEFRVPREHIQTSEYTIRPLYDYTNGIEQFRSYEVNHMIDVQTDKINQIGELIDAAVHSGANRVIDVQFILQDEGEYERIALNRALEDAAQKARSLAKTMNLTVITIPISIEEKVDYPPRLFQTAVQLDSFGATPIESGQLEIRAQVIAKFKY